MEFLTNLWSELKVVLLLGGGELGVGEVRCIKFGGKLPVTVADHYTGHIPREQLLVVISY